MVVALAGAVFTGSGTADASCAIGGPPPTVTAKLASADVAFVGVVVYTSDYNRLARVRVESIWKGPRIPAYVDVHGEDIGSGLFSSSEGDHQYQAGQRYLFFPLNDHPPFQDYGDCNSSTEVYTSEVAAYVPADARLPNPPTQVDAVANFTGQVSSGAIAGLVLVLAVIGVWVRRRRTRA